MHQRRPLRGLVVAGPLDRAHLFDLVIADTGEGRRGHGNLFHDLHRVGVVPVGAHGLGEHLGDFPIGIALLRGHHLAHHVDPALGVGEGAVLFQERGAREEHMGVIRGLVQEQVMHDHTFHRGEARRDVLGVRVGLQDVFALAVQPFEGALHGGIQHVGDTQARFVVDLHAPEVFIDGAHIVILHMAIARQFVREGSHVARALHVVLATQRVHTHARTANIAGHHRQVGNADHGGRALRMFRHAQTVVDRAVAAGGIGACSGADVLGLDAGQDFHRFGRMVRAADKLGIVLEFVPVAAGADELFVVELFGHDHMRQSGDHGDVGAGGQSKVMGGADVRAVHHFGAARVDDDQLRPFAQALFQARRKDRVARGGVGPDHDGHIGMFHRIKVLRAGRGAQSLAQAIAGGRMADPRAGVSVVVQEHTARQFLHQIGFFIGAARRGDHTHGLLSVFGNDALHAVRGKFHRLGP